MRTPQNQTGFTLIEVIIVLAIASLIFMVVFIAIPQLQASQRDSIREDTMNRFKVAITKYQSANSGALPDVDEVRNDLIPNYMNGDFADPIGGEYEIIRTSQRSRLSYKDAVVSYMKNWRCRHDGTGRIRRGGTRDYALMYKPEQGESQCRDNQ